MATNRSVSSPSYWKQRIPAPPAVTHFDAMFVQAVTDLAAMLRLSNPAPVPIDDPA